MAIPLIGLALGAFGIIQTIPPLANVIEQQTYKLLPNKLPSPGELAEALRRGIITQEEYDSKMRMVGFGERNQHIMQAASAPNLPLGVLIDALRREKLSPDDFDSQVKLLGFTPSQIETARRQMEFMPTPQDLVSWMAREVFEPDAVKAIGLDDEFSGVDLTLFGQAGVREDQARNFWRAHWQHPSFVQMAQGIRRGLVTEDTIDVWFRLVEIPPAWRHMLRNILFIPFTRVDIRRMWDLGVVEDADVVETYKIQGYTQENAEKLLLFTKVERTFPDIKARYRNGHIVAADIITELIALGLDPLKATFLQTTIVKADSGDRTIGQKNLTRTQIQKGVIQGLVTFDEGVTLLMQLGYEEWEALFILQLEDLGEAFFGPDVGSAITAYVQSEVRRVTGNTVDALQSDTADSQE